jgi:hypothetical protein
MVLKDFKIKELEAQLAKASAATVEVVEEIKPPTPGNPELEEKIKRYEAKILR